MGFAELAKKTMTKHCVKVPGDESVYLSTAKHIWSFFKLSLREHALFCTSVRHASNVRILIWRFQQWRHLNEILVDARANTAQHWKFCRWRQLSSMPIYNSVQKEKVLLSSYFQTSPNIVRVSGEQTVFAPAAAATPPHCDNTLHSSSCFKLCPCPLSVSCYAALGCTEQRASAQWLMNLELNYSTKLTTGRSQARAPENRRQCCYKSFVLQTLCLLSHWSMVYGTVSTSAMLYLLIYTQFLVSKVVTPLRGKSVRIGVWLLDREGGECWRAGDVIVM